MKFTPLNNCLRVKLEPVKAKSKPITRNDGTETELWVPDKHQERSRIGEVLSKGPDVSDRIAVGDIVAMHWNSGIVMHLTLDDYDDTDRVIVEHEILGKVEK